MTPVPAAFRLKPTTLLVPLPASSRLPPPVVVLRYRPFGPAISLLPPCDPANSPEPIWVTYEFVAAENTSMPLLVRSVK